MTTGAVTDRISAGIRKLVDEGHRIIWWSDPDGEFQDALNELALEGVELIQKHQEPALAVKRRVTLGESTQPIVLYEGAPAPAPDEDWLLDVRLYAAPFAADATSMLLQDLGLRRADLRDHLKSRARFFASKERTSRLAGLIQPDDSDREIDAKIWAVLAKSPSADAFTLIMDLLCDVAALDEGTTTDQSPLWLELKKYGLEAFAWRLFEAQFGYRDETPTLSRLVLRLFVTDMKHAVHAELPSGLDKLSLPETKASNVAVFLSQWRDSSTRQARYDQLSARVAAELDVPNNIKGLTPDAIGACSTFVDLERAVANGLRDMLLDNKAKGVAADIRRIANARIEGYWATTRCGDTDVGRRSIWRSYYRALVAATELFALIDAQAGDFSFTSPAEAYTAYTDSLFRVDQLYRQFHESADEVSGRYPDAMAPLDEQVENRYLNGFLAKLATHWDGHLRNGLLKSWTIPGIANQQNFHAGTVEPYLKGGDERRMFVIISDALRYEVAEELKARINSRERVQASLSSHLGVLPSYTRLGMASLLPHHTLAYTEKGSVLADGQSTDGLENRAKLLEKVGGIALKAEFVASKGKQELRDLVRPHRVVYIYHNTIDAVGDTASTESGTWLACRRAIQELSDLVGRLVNNAGATAITITADHGFLFRKTPPEAVNKSTLGDKPPTAIVSKKRYVVGPALPAADGALHGKTADTAGTSCDTEFLLPMGTGRFHFVGGARFVHGGASLQEVAVPLIEIRQKYGKSAAKTKVRKVGVNVLGQQHRITTNRHVFTLLQTEPVTERVLPCSVTVAIVNQNNEPVSSTALVRLESDSDDMNQWQNKVPLSLLGHASAKNDHHYLVLCDETTDVELQRIPVRIDLAIENDFDF